MAFYETNELGQTRQMRFAYFGLLDKIKDCDVNQIDINGQTILFYVLRVSNPVQQSRYWGGKINTQQDNMIKILIYLINNGVNVNHIDKNGDNILTCCIKKHNIIDTNMLIFLVNNGVNINHTNNGVNVLTHYLKNHEFMDYEFILKLGANVNINTIIPPTFRRHHSSWNSPVQIKFTGIKLSKLLKLLFERGLTYKYLTKYSNICDLEYFIDNYKIALGVFTVFGKRCPDLFYLTCVFLKTKRL